MATWWTSGRQQPLSWPRQRRGWSRLAPPRRRSPPCTSPGGTRQSCPRRLRPSRSGTRTCFCIPSASAQKAEHGFGWDLCGAWDEEGIHSGNKHKYARDYTTIVCCSVVVRCVAVVVEQWRSSLREWTVTDPSASCWCTASPWRGVMTGSLYVIPLITRILTKDFHRLKQCQKEMCFMYFKSKCIAAAKKYIFGNSDECRDWRVQNRVFINAM